MQKIIALIMGLFVQLCYTIAYAAPTTNGDDASVALCMDPQTSGGLLAAVTRVAA